MIKNYIRITLWNLKRHPGFSFINISGLATGMAAFVLIVLFIQNERSFDQHNEHAQNVYQVILDAAVAGQEFLTSSSPAVMATKFQEDFPEIEAAVRINAYSSDALVTVGETPYYEAGFVMADSSLFDVFTIPFLAGDPATALNMPNTMVISETIARKYFGNSDPIGQTVRHDNRNDYEITGVFADLPQTSFFRPEVIASFLTSERWNDQIWLNNSFNTFIRLSDGSNSEALKAKFPDFLRTYVGPQIEQFTGMPYDEALSSGIRYQWDLERLSEIYLYSKAQDQIGPTGDIRYLYILGIIALIVLTIACINFMNLSTARATGRAREVGIRKTLGSERGQLIRQFLGESITMSLISMVIAFALVLLLLPVFANVLDAHLSIEPWLPAVILGVALLTGVVAGLYPAFVLSGFEPALVLKGSFSSSRSGTWLRSSLVVFQFGISVVLLVGTTVVYKQLDFIQNRDVGFNKDHVVVLPIETSQALESLDTVRNRLLQRSDVVSVASAGILPGPDHIHNSTIFRADGMRPEDTIVAALGEVSPGYEETIGLDIIAGRGFSRDVKSDSAGTVLNEAAVEAFGFTVENAVGQTIYRLSGMPDDSDRPMTVLGVVRDANYQSLHQEVMPIVLGGWQMNQSYLPVRIRPENLQSTLAGLEEIWTEWEPGYPFRYYFMDADYQQYYAQEQRLGNIYIGFTILAILIACLGLFGLASFITSLRTKEIGVRKVMGASVPSIVFLLSKEFTILVLISCAVGFPIAWYAMDLWLQDFAYATDIGWAVFAMAGAVSLSIAWLTVSYQSIRAAVANPVRSLKYQ